MNFPTWIWSTARAEETVVTGTMIGDTKHSPHSPHTPPGITATPLLVRRLTEWQREERKNKEKRVRWGENKREEIEVGRRGCKHWVNTCLLWNGKHRAAPTVALVTPWESDCWHQRHTQAVANTTFSKQTFQLLLGHLSTLSTTLFCYFSKDAFCSLLYTQSYSVLLQGFHEYIIMSVYISECCSGIFFLHVHMYKHVYFVAWGH